MSHGVTVKSRLDNMAENSPKTRMRRFLDAFDSPPIKSAFLLTLILFGAQMICEIVFRLTILRPLFNIGLLHAAFFALARSAGIVSVVSFFPPKVARVLYSIVIVSFSIIYSAQLVYYKFFRTFFIVYSLERSGQVAEFIGDIFLKIAMNIPTILFLLLPSILFFIYLYKRRPIEEFQNVSGWKKALTGLGCSVLLFGLSIVSMAFNRSYNSPWQNYFHHNELLLGSHQFGVMTAIEIDIRRFLSPPVLPDDTLVRTDEDIEMTLPTVNDTSVTQPTDPATNPSQQTTYDPQVWPIDFEKRLEGYTFPDDRLLQPATREDQARYLDDAFSKTAPTYMNDHTGRGKGFNLIFISAESFSPYCIDPVLTPTLYKMYKEGIQFTNYYNPMWSVSTLDGEYAGLCGMIPKQGVWSLVQSAGNDMSYAPGNFFKRLGYNTYAWHDHTWTYYERDVSHPNLGYTYRGIGNGLDLEPLWPKSDNEMIEKTTPEFIDKEPFHVYYLTVSGHMPYSQFGNAMSERHWNVYPGDISNEARAYLACNYEVELAMQTLIERLQEAGIMDRTLIVLNPDHHPYGIRHSTYEEIAGHSLDETFDVYKSVLLFYHEGIEPEQVDKYCCSLDILPTIYNYMGVPYESRLLSGRDIFSDAEGLVCLLGKSWITDYGKYDALTNEFTLHDGASLDIPEDLYVSRVNREVMLRFQTAELVLDCDYYLDLISDDTWKALVKPYRDYMQTRSYD